MTTPWNSIAESIVEKQTTGELTHTQALVSPCQSCPTAPCCTHLPLNTFKVTNLVELDHARYLLNFPGIELGISASGDWSSYYTYPCRFLNRQSFQCDVHNQPEQPRICVNYNPYNCWYKRVFSSGQTDDLVRIDFDRMQVLLPTITFDDQRHITSVPDWTSLVQLMDQFDDQRPAQVFEPEREDPALIAWQNLAISGGEDTPTGPEPANFDPLAEPCDGCAAYCCKTLVFPQNAPHHVSNLDYYRFCLGFPGVELGVSDSGWSTAVKTRCRHLTSENRCSIYGRPERPLICRYYDSWKCDYREHFGAPRPAGLLRVRLEEFAWLAECFEVSDQGVLVNCLPVEAIRQVIEQHWQPSPPGN